MACTHCKQTNSFAHPHTSLGLNLPFPAVRPPCLSHMALLPAKPSLHVLTAWPLKTSVGSRLAARKVSFLKKILDTSVRLLLQ